MMPCGHTDIGRRIRWRALGVLCASAAMAGLSPAAWSGAFDVSRNREIQLGREAAAVFEQQVHLSNDPVLVAKVERIGRRLVRVVDRPDLPYEFHVVATDDINALAFPGGFVYAFAGLVEAMPSDDALAFVLAHEIAHAAKRHWARRYEKARKLSVLTLGYADILHLFLQPHYSRRYESEADRYGMLWATRAGFKPGGALEAMQALKELSGSRRGLLPIFRSHPLTQKRINRLTSQIESLKNEMAAQQEPPATARPPTPPDVPAGAGDLSGHEIGPNTHFPLRVGARWVYRCATDDGDTLRRAVSITGSVPGAEQAFRLENSYGHGVRVESFVATTRNAVLVRSRSNGADSGWQVEWLTDLDDGESANGGDFEFVGGGTEEIAVPLGRFTAVRIEKRRVGSSSPTAIAWFVDGIGLVKQHSPADGLTEVLESCSPGDQPATEAEQSSAEP